MIVCRVFFSFLSFLGSLFMWELWIYRYFCIVICKNFHNHGRLSTFLPLFFLLGYCSGFIVSINFLLFVPHLLLLVFYILHFTMTLFVISSFLWKFRVCSVLHLAFNCVFHLELYLVCPIYIQSLLLLGEDFPFIH